MTPQELIIGPQTLIGTTWFDRTQVDRGRFHADSFPVVPPPADQLDAYINANYYDLGLCMYGLHQRTGEQADQARGRKIADSWWKSPHIKEGTVRTFDTFTHTPRNSSLGGLILRALDGRPEMWDWINAYTRHQFDNWLKKRINDPQLFYGVRDGAFMLQYAAWLAVALPDSFPLQAGGMETNGAALRAQYLADVEAVTVNYFQRLQQPDGSWRWDDHDSPDQLRGIMQPFQIGLLMHALINVHDVTGKPEVKASIVNQVTKACRHLYSDGPYSKQRIPIFGVDLRGFHYIYHGGTAVNPTKYEKGDLPADFANWNPAWDVQNQRQPIGLLVAAYGWCYKQTGDPFFKAAGDELWDSAYGSTDGIHNYMAGDAKSYNQNCRWAGSYLVWAGNVTHPVPDPPPATPIQPSTSTPSLDGTKGATIRDNQGGVWTFGSQKQTLRNGTHMSAGFGSVYKYLNQIVYVLGTDDQWYQWGAAGWSHVGPEPGVIVAEPPIPTTPTPVPNPTPAPTPTTRKVAWPRTEAGQESTLNLQWAERYRLKTTKVSGDFAIFEKVN